jgi:hypothetical protein
LIVWSALFAGVVFFATIATALRPGFLQQGNEGVELLAWIALGMALVGLLASRVVPNLGKPMPGATPDGVGFGRTVMASALNEGSALLAVVVWMLGGRALALVALAISLAGLLLAFPSTARWQSLCRSSERAERPNPLVR